MTRFGATGFRPAQAARIGEGEAFLSSLAAPGLAQYRLGSRRWLFYAGVETLAALLYVSRRSDARGERRAYRDLAWTAARTGASLGARRDGDFAYYEALSNWTASGAWDADPSRPGIQPETDPSTYNGSVWALAAALYDLDAAAARDSPRFGRALEYYQEHGYASPFLWDWGEGSERERFSRLVERSDRLFGQARRALWIVVANHVASALDGFVSVRLAALPGGRALRIVVSARAR